MVVRKIFNKGDARVIKLGRCWYVYHDLIKIDEQSFSAAEIEFAKKPTLYSISKAIAEYNEAEGRQEIFNPSDYEPWL
ncbi:MAG: hypothetical protein MJZ64_00285 [Paludibacteraceae bacterium]|nr:hypothetical protein [Paludibacteraceae bacterium]